MTMELAPLVEPLLAWYRREARTLPWRQEPTPYRVWISEIMLQQTRVEAVKPYFERFIAALPDVASLAAVEDDTLLKLWEGLGYYSRARNLKRAAGQIIAGHGGNFPHEQKDLMALPGIGPYTAGAIASIAFGIAVPAVDGNVLRVVCRFLAWQDDIMKEQTKKEITAALATVIPPGCPGDFNQALMELGALLCLPKNPKCGQCPVAGTCLARKKGLTAVLPVRAAKKARRLEDRTVFLFCHKGRIALRSREKKGLLAGLWELPNLPGHLEEMDIFAAFPDFTILSIVPLGPAKHVFTHLEWHMTGYGLVVEEPNEEWLWVTPAALAAAYPLPVAFRFYRNQIEPLLGNKNK